jgi:hypothetical protein
VQQPLQPHVLAQRSEFRLDACPLERERPPRGRRALQERDRGAGVAPERMRRRGVVLREGLVGTEAHAPIEGFDRLVERASFWRSSSQTCVTPPVIPCGRSWNRRSSR